MRCAKTHTLDQEPGTLTEWLEEAKPTEWVKRTGLLDVAEEQKILQQGAVTQTKTVTWNVAAINNNPFEYACALPFSNLQLGANANARSNPLKAHVFASTCETSTSSIFKARALTPGSPS